MRMDLAGTFGSGRPQAGGKSLGSVFGFTLLETVIVLTILGLVATVMFASFRFALNSYLTSQERLAEEAHRRVLHEQIRRQIGSLFALRPTGAFLEPQEGSTTPPDLPAMAYAQIPLFYGSSESVTFITVAPLMLMENPGLTVVRYGLAQDEYGRYYLGAMERRFVGLGSFVEMAGNPQGKPLPLVEGIERLQFEYYGYLTESQEYGWAESWNGEERQAVPRAIRIWSDDQEMTVPVNAVFIGNFPMGGLEAPLGRSPQAVQQVAP